MRGLCRGRTCARRRRSCTRHRDAPARRELCVLVDELLHEPWARDAIDPRMFTCDPFHRHLLCADVAVFVASPPRTTFGGVENIYAPPLWLIVLGAVLTALAVAVFLYAWPPSRDRRRIVVGAVAAVAAFLMWRVALVIANGANLDVDYPVLLGLSFEDIGSGVMAFLFAALAL